MTLEQWRKENPHGPPKGDRKPAQNPYEKWLKNDSRAKAIAAYCWGCMGGSENDSIGIRKEIKECTCGPTANPPCPLWNWRPYK